MARKKLSLQVIFNLKIKIKYWKNLFEKHENKLAKFYG